MLFQDKAQLSRVARNNKKPCEGRQFAKNCEAKVISNRKTMLRENSGTFFTGELGGGGRGAVPELKCIQIMHNNRIADH